MPGSIPVIFNPTPPGGHLYATEVGLPQGSAPGSGPTTSSWTFSIKAEDGIAQLSVGGYAAIRDGVFSAGGADLGYGRLEVTRFDPGSGEVGVVFTLTGPYASAPGAGPSRYGDITTHAITLTDRDGDTVSSQLLVQIRDDDRVAATDDQATAVAGGAAARGNVITGAAPDLFSADGVGGVTRIAYGPDWSPSDAGFDSAGQLEVRGAFGVLRMNAAGEFAYTADAGAQAGATDRFSYWVADRDGDQDFAWLTVTIAKSDGGASPGDDDMQGRELHGGPGNDTLTGTDGQDLLRGDDGADRLIGGAAFDDLHGNMGNDTVWGGLGDDWVVGGKDQDVLYGEEGGDVVLGNLGADTLDGGGHDDIVRGGQANDSVSGGWGADWVSGDRGEDTVAGGGGADIFHTFAEAGLDRVIDFNRAEGDRVNVLPGTQYSLAQVGADTVIDMGGGARMVLVNVQLSSLDPGWIFS